MFCACFQINDDFVIVFFITNDSDILPVCLSLVVLTVVIVSVLSFSSLIVLQ